MLSDPLSLTLSPKGARGCGFDFLKAGTSALPWDMEKISSTEGDAQSLAKRELSFVVL